jgi:hypothetical protein
MGLDDILPMIRNVADLRERGRQREAEAEVGDCGGVAEYHAAAELEERIRQPIVVAGRVLTIDLVDRWSWWSGGSAEDGCTLMLTTAGEHWQATLSACGSGSGTSVGAGGFGPTIAAALSDAHARYQAAIDDVLLRMADLLREVGK